MGQWADTVGSDGAVASTTPRRRLSHGPRSIAVSFGTFAIVTGFVSPGDAPNSETISLCGEHRAPLAQLIDNAVGDGYLISAGLPAARRSNRVAEYFAVDEQYWLHLADNQRALLAFAAYCRTGHGTDKGIVVIEGMHDGTALAAVVDGEYVANPDRLAKVL